MSERPEPSSPVFRLPEAKTLLIMTGGPGTGKTGLTRRLLAHLSGVSVISYDAVKEKNWDRFGFDNNAQKNRLNAWGLEEFYLTIQKQMWENKTILIEYPFYQRHRPKLQELIEEYGYQAVTLFLHADLHTVYERGCRRDHDGSRHPGHLLDCYHKETYTPDLLKALPDTNVSFEEFCAGIAGKDYDVNLGLRIPVDVSDFSAIDFEGIIGRIIDYERKT